MVLSSDVTEEKQQQSFTGFERIAESATKSKRLCRCRAELAEQICGMLIRLKIDMAMLNRQGLTKHVSMVLIVDLICQHNIDKGKKSWIQNHIQ